MQRSGVCRIDLQNAVTVSLFFFLQNAVTENSSPQKYSKMLLQLQLHDFMVYMISWFSNLECNDSEKNGKDQSFGPDSPRTFLTLMHGSPGLYSCNIRSTWNCGMACESSLRSLNTSDWPLAIWPI